MRKIISILSIYFVGALLFGMGFSLFTFGHSLFTESSPDDSRNIIKLSSLSTYLENPFTTDQEKRAESKNLLFEHKPLLDKPISPFKEQPSPRDIPSHAPDIQIINHLLYPTLSHSNHPLGTLKIDSLSLEVPIYYDVDITYLKDGLSHDLSTVFPGVPEHCVLYGNGSTLLKEIKHLEKNELIFIRTSAGLFTYQVQDMYPVSNDDSTFPELTGEPSLSLTAIYSNHGKKLTQRYVVYSTLVDYSLYS